MKQTLLALLTFLVCQIGYSQSISQTWADPCTGETKVVTVPLTGSTVVTMYNQSRVVNAQDILNGTLTAWVQSVYTTYSSLSPCSQSQSQANATQQNVQQTAQQAAQAASQAATAAPVAPVATPPPTPAPTTTNQNTTNGTNQTQNQSSSNNNQAQGSTDTGNTSGDGAGSSDSTSGSEGSQDSTSSESTGSTEDKGSESTEASDTESSSEESGSTESEGTEDSTSGEEDSKKEGGDSEESSEDKQEEEVEKEEDSKSEESEEESEDTTEEESVEEEEKEEKKEKKKKKKKNTAPPIIVANVSTMEGLDRTFSTAMTLGYSKSSLRGDKSYGVTSMVWSNLKQYMVMANYSKTFFVKGAPRFVYSASLMGSRMFSTLSAGNNHSIVYLGKKGTVAGLSLGASTIYLNYKIREGGVLVDQALLSGNITSFATKPFNFDRYSLSPMLAVSLPLINHDLYSKETTYNKDIMIITGVSANYALTKKFYLNLGINATHNTNKEIRSLLNFTIGSRFQF